MAKSRPPAPPLEKRSGPYTAMLFVTLVAMIGGCVLLYMDYEEYGKKSPEATPKLDLKPLGTKQADGPPPDAAKDKEPDMPKDGDPPKDKDGKGDGTSRAPAGPLLPVAVPTGTATRRPVAVGGTATLPQPILFVTRPVPVELPPVVEDPTPAAVPVSAPPLPTIPLPPGL